jgi:hypothetical protein
MDSHSQRREQFAAFEPLETESTSLWGTSEVGAARSLRSLVAVGPPAKQSHEVTFIDAIERL